MSFVRSFSDAAIEQLQQEALFMHKLRTDIVTGSARQRQKEHSVVFPAVRDGRIDFYWAGGKLFSYVPGTGFSTHHKYASVLTGHNGDYVAESSLKNGKARLIEDFYEGYDRIKENCELYSGLEALGVSSLYERFSCSRKDAPAVVVLDIEASFAKGESKEKDRIDMVCLDTKNGILRFFEAKHYSNNASLRTSGKKPPVVSQMKRYTDQIKERQEEILDGYKAQVRIINALFDLSIPEPITVAPEPALLIFGFDNEQRSYLKDKIAPRLEEAELRFYEIGEIKKADLAVVFRGGKKNWV